MSSDEIKIFFEFLDDDEYCLLYNGNFIDAITSKIINITKVSLIQRGELIKTQNRFAYLIAECFQNIIRHGGHKEHKIEDKRLPGFFMAKIKNSFYDLLTGNLIDDKNITALKEQFDQIKALSRDELKRLYNKRLAEGQLSEKGGAGLGLIDMAKKSDQLEYKFLNNAENNAMFYQRLVMAPNKNLAEREGKDHNINFGIELHNAMINHNILVLQKSDFSRHTVLPMLSILEGNVNANQNDETLIKTIYQILIDLMHNINHYNLKLKDKKEGLFLISKTTDSYRISSGYYINSKKVNWLKCFIEKGLSMNNEDLEKAYLSKLNIGNTSTSEPISVAKIIADRFSFNFHEIDDETSIFSIHANI